MAFGRIFCIEMVFRDAASNLVMVWGILVFESAAGSYFIIIVDVLGVIKGRSLETRGHHSSKLVLDDRYL